VKYWDHIIQNDIVYRVPIFTYCIIVRGNCQRRRKVQSLTLFFHYFEDRVWDKYLPDTKLGN